MKTYEFFEGLSANDLNLTLAEYTAANAGWTVHTVGENSDGFWVLLDRAS